MWRLLRGRRVPACVRCDLVCDLESDLVWVQPVLLGEAHPPHPLRVRGGLPGLPVPGRGRGAVASLKVALSIRDRKTVTSGDLQHRN